MTTLDIPGVDKDELEVRYDEEGRCLTVSAEHTDDSVTRTYHRSYRPPKEVDADGIEATYTNGVLEVRLPVVEEEEGVRVVEIE